MKKTPSRIASSKPRRQNRELLVTIAVFLLNQEELRKQFWNVKSAHYDINSQTVKIGINTTNGKLGTTLSKLRKVSKRLSDYLFDHGLTFRKATISFYVDKTGAELERIYNLLQQFEK